MEGDDDAQRRNRIPVLGVAAQGETETPLPQTIGAPWMPCKQDNAASPSFMRRNILDEYSSIRRALSF
jgi:hypothetical protein